ncbi:MAG TPA: glycosyltransferase family 9 protein [Candidatus Limnocylindrales bacterium]|nr:glycosyltransferase family 9 protein [Candidatus Limnocylindrales bacterium]
MTVRPVGGRLTVLEAGELPLWGTATRQPLPSLASGSPEGWAEFERVLAVRLDAMGDVLMTTPALRALKAVRPERQLTLLTSSAGAEVAALLPEIDETIVYDPPWMKAPSSPDPASDRAMIERLAAGRFDAAAIFTVHTQSPHPTALLCHLAGIARRLGHSRENPYRLLTEWVAEPEADRPLRHETRRQLDLVAAVGLDARDDHLSLRVPADAYRRVRGHLAAAGLDVRKPWLLVHPGASASSRRYPPERWVEAARIVTDTTGWPIVWSGAANERSFVAECAAATGAVALHGGSVADLAALVALAPIVATNNTGPAHIAAAVGTPVVDVYAQTNAQHAPWHVPNRVVFADVPCRDCRRSVCPQGHHRCLLDVPPGAVADAVLDVAIEVGLSVPAPVGSFAPVAGLAQ